MLRRQFIPVLSCLLSVPLPKAVPHDSLAIPDSTIPDAPPTDPAALREWLQVPRGHVSAEDLPWHRDVHQRALAAEILRRMADGAPLSFRYDGGSDPGRQRQVLPVWLFQPDYQAYYLDDQPEPDETPIYLHAWCCLRRAARIFRLDRMHVDFPLPPLPFQGDP